MDKYQQRLVRHQLQSLLSVPIFNKLETRTDSRQRLSNAFLGVLNFDSDDRILPLLTKREVLEAARDCAGLVANMLLSR